MHCCWSGPTAEIASGYCIIRKALNGSSLIPYVRSSPQGTRIAEGRDVDNYVSTLGHQDRDTKARSRRSRTIAACYLFCASQVKDPRFYEVHLEPLACSACSRYSRRCYCTNRRSSIDN